MMPPDVDDSSPLLDLFRSELRDGLNALLAGLPALQQATELAQRAEPLQQAAHAIRGAAALVSLPDAVQLAGALEDRIRQIVSRESPATVQELEDLLNGVSLLSELGDADALVEWCEANRQRIQHTCEPLQRSSPRPVAPAAPVPAPAPTAPPVSSPIIVPALSMADLPLLELFREEVRGHAETLTAGLVTLERQPNDTRQIEPLMRAAHSIKGAARVVNINIAVEIAHIAEDTLVAAQKGQRVLTPDDIDVLLAASDLLSQIADATSADFAGWIQSNQHRIDEVLARLQGAPAPLPAPVPVVKAAPTAPAPVAPAPTLTTPPVRTPAPTPIIVPPAPAEAPRLTSGGEEKERVVRVTAQSLSRLMSLAGESLVEARWLQPFAGSLLKLKKQHDYLSEILDELWQSPWVREGPTETRQLIAEGREMLTQCSRALAERIGEFESHSRQSDDLNSRLYREVIASRMRPFLDGAQGFPRLVRDLARQLGKKVEFDIIGERSDVDRDILEKLEAPLNHLLRNALDHGMEMPEDRLAAGKPETGRITVEARHNAGMLQITVSDDGRGIDVERLRRKIVERGHTTSEMASRMSEPELLDFLFLPGFSTADRVTEVSGRGVGLDVVHSMVHAVGGRVWIQTKVGAGTRFNLQLPITLSVIRAVIVEIAEEPYAFPLNRIDRLLRLPRTDLCSMEGRQFVTVDGVHVGLILARQVLELPGDEPGGDDLFIVLFSSQTSQYGLIVDRFLGEQDLVVRPLDARLGKVPDISAAALLDDGSPVLIADVEDLTRSIEDILKGGRLRRAQRRGQLEVFKRRKRILVVDDSITVREVQKQLLGGRGFEVETAVDGMDGLDALRDATYDLIVSDIDMPRMNGLEFVRNVKNDHRLQHIPVIIVSYKDREEDRLRGLEAGANYYLTKSSFHDERLLNAVEEMIGEA